MHVYDHGCGSGAFSLLLNEQFNFEALVLTDLDNYASEFSRWYIMHNKLPAVRWENVLIQKNTELAHTAEYDLVICLDVLEHLENCYHTLLLLDSKLKQGGIFFLKIAFEYDDKTHLPQAAEDFFFKNDGLKFLEDNYTLIKPLPQFGQLVCGF